MKTCLFFLSLILSLSHNVSAQIEYSAIWEQEWAIDKNGNSQKFETLFEPEWNTSLTDNSDMTFIGRIRFDLQTNLGPEEDMPVNYSSINGPLLAGDHGELSIREWYIDTEIVGSYWRIGKQQVVWGQADGLKVLDVINPQSYREFILDDFEDSRIPLWMFNVEIPVGNDNSLQLLWIQDLSYNEFAESGSTYQMTSPLLVPQLPAGLSVAGLNKSKPISIIKDSDLGLRYLLFYEGWDLTFNYLYHYHDSPVIYQTVENNNVILNSKYERNHLLGATASKAFGDFTLRTEIGFSSDTFHLIDTSSLLYLLQQGIHKSADISSVLGIDWQGLEDTLLSFQWFQSYLFDHDDSLFRPVNNNILSFLYKQTFENEIWEIEILAIHGFDKGDGVVQSKFSYLLEGNIQLWIGSDIFYGQKQGLFGQFKDTNRLIVGFEWGF